ncbi:MAG: response regulator [Archangiaceae bacterium]|nr:response regulator [Archangiaceae bacterium]
MKRVLFVDDEQAVLEGLKNQLRKHRREWEMVFVTSGRDALAQLERGPFDVLISDMRMPELDGAELLALVKVRWPQTACYVLSGYADPEARRRAMAVARAYFAKPCEIEKLEAAIEGRP